MTEFSTEEVVRQSLRSLVHELAMGLLASKDNGKKQLVQTKTKSYIRSAEFLRKLYENPTRYLSNILSDVSGISLYFSSLHDIPCRRLSQLEMSRVKHHRLPRKNRGVLLLVICMK